MVDQIQTPQGRAEEQTDVSGGKHTSAPPNGPHGAPRTPYGEMGFTWRNRRRMLWGASLFCMGIIAYVIHKELDSKVAETAVTMAFFCLGSLVGSYVFGAAWQDINIVKTMRGGRGRYHTPPRGFPPEE